MFSGLDSPYPGLMTNAGRRAAVREYLVCTPEHFAVTYAINPWMEPANPTDAGLARRQWARVPEHVHEGEGDILVAGRTLLAGYGFRTDRAVAAELTGLFGLPVVSLRLVDPRFYHLDTALCVLDSDTAMYYPAAFDDAGRAAIAEQFTELIEAKDEDAEVLGLNAVSDGRHVVLPAQAAGLGRHA